MSTLLNRKQRLLLYKFFALLSIVRWYNILLLVIAQYLAIFFVFAKEQSFLHTIADIEIHLIVLASSFVIAGGYIINSFYDLEKDLVNRPKDTLFDRLISKRTCLNFYFIFNLIGLGLASLASYRVLIFFGGFAFLLWFYSHKLKKMTFVGNLTSALLSVVPFFAVLLYYQTFTINVFVYGGFITLLILIRDMIKDLSGVKGDVIYGYQTVPVELGTPRAKNLIYLLMIFAFLPPVIIYFSLHNHYIWTTTGLVLLGVFVSAIMLFKAKTPKQYQNINNLYKLLILLGVFSVVFI